MSLATLEGYLVALIAWPVAVPTGAWLPPIWGERGWKVPTKIAARSHYTEFVGLIVGFMQALERSLSSPAGRLESSVLREFQGRARTEALQAWGNGFRIALALDSQGLKWRSDSTRAAVRVIAAKTSAATPPDPNAAERVVSAVLALIGQRMSRGPLGSLDSVAAIPIPG